MDVVTVPEISRRTGYTRPQVERVVSQYAHELPEPTRVGITRVWPAEIVQRVRDIMAREQRCVGGSR